MKGGSGGPENRPLEGRLREGRETAGKTEREERKELFFLSLRLFLGPILVMRIDQWGREVEIEL